jgi:heme A synthase
MHLREHWPDRSRVQKLRMMIHRWLEKPRALAALTLAFALVPVVFAYVTFRAARERVA